MTVEEFIYLVNEAISNYTDKLDNKTKLGQPGLKDYIIRGFLLNMCGTILIDYVSPASSGDENFFTAEYAKNILQHFNNIAGTYINYEF